MQEDIIRFDTQLAQQLIQNIDNQQGNINSFNCGGGGSRGRGRGQGFRPRGNFHQQNGQYYNSGQYNHPANYQHPPYNNNNNPPDQIHPQNNYHLPTSFRPRNPNFANDNNKRSYPQNNNNNYYNQWQSWPNKRPRFDSPSPYQPPSSSNRIDYRYVANQNNYHQQQQQQFH